MNIFRYLWLMWKLYGDVRRAYHAAFFNTLTDRLKKRVEENFWALIEAAAKSSK